MCLVGRQNPDAPNAMMQSVTAGLQLGKHAASNHRLTNQSLNSLESQPWDNRPVGIFHARHICQKDQRVSLTSHRASRRHLVGVDVVILAIRADRDTGDHRNSALPPDGFHPARLNHRDLADKPEIVSIAIFLACPEHHAVSAAQADRRLSSRANRGNQALVDNAREYHERNIPGFRIGHAQPIDEIALLPKKLQGASEGGTPAMDYGHLVAILSEVDHGARAFVQRRFVFERCATDFDDYSQLYPSVSSSACVRFMFLNDCRGTALM